MENKISFIDRICPHCAKDMAIRNPSGFCDHLYYPDNCDVCRGPRKIQISEAELTQLRGIEEAARELIKASFEIIWMVGYDDMTTSDEILIENFKKSVEKASAALSPRPQAPTPSGDREEGK